MRKEGSEEEVGGDGGWTDSGGQPVACHMLNVVPSLCLLWCCVDRSGPRNVCHFMHRLSAAKFRRQDCRRLLNVQQQHRDRETAGLMWQPELSEGPIHDFLSFCEDLEPVSTPSATKPLDVQLSHVAERAR